MPTNSENDMQMGQMHLIHPLGMKRINMELKLGKRLYFATGMSLVAELRLINTSMLYPQTGVGLRFASPEQRGRSSLHTDLFDRILHRLAIMTMLHSDPEIEQTLFRVLSRYESSRAATHIAHLMFPDSRPIVGNRSKIDQKHEILRFSGSTTQH